MQALLESGRLEEQAWVNLEVGRQRRRLPGGGQAAAAEEPGEGGLVYPQLLCEPIDVMQLRRSVSVARKPATIPLVEEYLDSTGCKDPWERQVHYLVAGLWGTMVSVSYTHLRAHET